MSAEGRRVARVVFIGSFMASVAANAASAWTVEADLEPWQRAAVASLWPLALVAAEALITRVPSTGRTVDRVRSTVAGLIALVAFTGSAEHLAHLATMAGASPMVAWSTPILIDLLLILAGLTLVDLDRRSAVAVHAETALADALAQAEALKTERDTLATRLNSETKKAGARLTDVEGEAENLAARLAAAPDQLEDTEAARGELAETFDRWTAAQTGAQAPVLVGADTGTVVTPPATGAPQGERVAVSPSSPAPSSTDTAGAIAAYLADHPGATAAEVAAAVGCSDRTVRRSDPWRDHRKKVAA